MTRRRVTPAALGELGLHHATEADKVIVLDGFQRIEKSLIGIVSPVEVPAILLVVAIEVIEILAKLPRSVEIGRVDVGFRAGGKFSDVRRAAIDRHRSGEQRIEEFLGNVVRRD